MVRIVSLDPSIDRPIPDSASAGFGWAAWASGPLARWLEREGYAFEPRNCGDGSWAVLARKASANACVVATGFPDVARAVDWIRGEIEPVPG